MVSRLFFQCLQLPIQSLSLQHGRKHSQRSQIGFWPGCPELLISQHVGILHNTKEAEHKMRLHIDTLPGVNVCWL